MSVFTLTSLTSNISVDDLLGNASNISNVTENDTVNTELIQSLTRGIIPPIVLIAVLSVLGTVGNAHVLPVFIFKMKTNSTYTVYVISLATIDLLVSVVHMPCEILDLYYPYNLWNPITCRLFRYNNFVLSMASVLVLLVVAIDRYKRVCRTLSKQWSVPLSKRLVIGCVVLAAICASPSLVLFGIRTVELDEKTSVETCFLNDQYKDSAYVVAWTGSIYVLYIVASFILIFAYISIYVRIKKQSVKRAYLTRRINTVERKTKLSSPKKSCKEINCNAIHDHQERMNGQNTSDAVVELSNTDTNDSGIVPDHQNCLTASNEQGCKLDTTNASTRQRSDDSSSPRNTDSPKTSTSSPWNADSPKTSISSPRNADSPKTSTSSPRNADSPKLSTSSPMNADSPKTSTSTPRNADSPKTSTSSPRNADSPKTSTSSPRNADSPKTSTSSPRNADSPRTSTSSPRNADSPTTSTSSPRNADSPRTSTSSPRNADSPKTSTFKEGNRITKIVALITIFFLVCHLPYLTFAIVFGVYPDFKLHLNDTEILLYRLAMRLVLLNNVCNAFIYGIFDKRFMQLCKEMYSKCCCCCRQTVASNNANVAKTNDKGN